MLMLIRPGNVAQQVIEVAVTAQMMQDNGSNK
jgi:hypothetical protein